MGATTTSKIPNLALCELKMVAPLAKPISLIYGVTLVNKEMNECGKYIWFAPLSNKAVSCELFENERAAGWTVGDTRLKRSEMEAGQCNHFLEGCWWCFWWEEEDEEVEELGFVEVAESFRMSTRASSLLRSLISRLLWLEEEPWLEVEWRLGEPARELGLEL